MADRQRWYRRLYGMFGQGKQVEVREPESPDPSSFRTSEEEDRHFGWIPCRSSNVAGFRYRPEQQQLEVKFNNGNVYGYYGVPESVYDDMFMSGSKGKFVAEHLRNNFAFSLIRGTLKGLRH